MMVVGERGSTIFLKISTKVVSQIQSSLIIFLSLLVFYFFIFVLNVHACKAPGLG